MGNNVIAALKEKFKGLDTVEKVLATIFLVLLLYVAVSYMQGFFGGGTSAVGAVGGTATGGGRGGSGLGGLGMLGRGVGG